MTAVASSENLGEINFVASERNSWRSVPLLIAGKISVNALVEGIHIKMTVVSEIAQKESFEREAILCRIGARFKRKRITSSLSQFVKNLTDM